MASRCTAFRPVDYCFSPLKILKDGEYIYVPCGKCNGCKLQKINSWSQRLSYEIDNNPFSIFFTLTYDNYFLPTLIPFKTATSDFFFVSDHPNNVRFDGSHVVLRDDRIIIRGVDFIPIENDSRKFTVNYASKRDIQLWLKLVRKDLSFKFPNYEFDFFRYYIISEIGPRTHRAHFHGILFPRNKEISECLLDSSMYQNWQMCDKFLFQQYTKYCNSGTSTYVSNYVSSYTNLPSIYQNPAIRPFRLSSKAPSIGFAAFDKEKIFEQISAGIITYIRQISRIDKTFVLGYPSTYCNSLFPKCYRYAELSYSRLLWVYGILYREIRGYKRPYFLLSQRFRQVLHSSDFTAAQKCYEYCNLIGCTPVHYLYLLDMYYYKRSMLTLSRWYQWQESNYASPVKIIRSYVNFSDYVSRRNSLSDYQLMVISIFCEQFMIDFLSLDSVSLFELIDNSSESLSYREQVDDIFNNLDKSKKINELTFKSPHFI